MAEDTPPTLQRLDRFKETDPDDHVVVERFIDYYGDSFTDVLASFIEWREKGRLPNSFLKRQLNNWGVQSWIGEYNPAVLKRVASKGIGTLVLNDEATISTALSQLVVDGKIVVADRKKAEVCINRQISEVVLEARGYRDKEDARKVLEAVGALIGKR